MPSKNSNLGQLPALTILKDSNFAWGNNVTQLALVMSFSGNGGIHLKTVVSPINHGVKQKKESKQPPHVFGYGQNLLIKLLEFKGIHYDARKRRCQPGQNSSTKAWFVYEKQEFELLYKQYFPMVHYFFLKKNVPNEEAMELAQDTFVRIYQHGEAFRSETTFRNWVYLVAGSVWKNYLRTRHTNKRKGTVVNFDTTTPIEQSQHDDPEHQIVKKAERQQLRQSIENLPEKTRQVVRLRIYQDLKFADIAKLLGRTEDTVKSQMSQAKKKLEREHGT